MGPVLRSRVYFLEVKILQPGNTMKKETEVNDA